MKRSRLLLIMINYIYHDNIYLMSPIVDWNLLDVLNKNIRNNYERIRPILLKWQENGYIKLRVSPKTQLQVYTLKRIIS